LLLFLWVKLEKLLLFDINGEWNVNEVGSEDEKVVGVTGEFISEGGDKDADNELLNPVLSSLLKKSIDKGVAGFEYENFESFAFVSPFSACGFVIFLKRKLLVLVLLLILLLCLFALYFILFNFWDINEDLGVIRILFFLLYSSLLLDCDSNCCWLLEFSEIPEFFNNILGIAISFLYV